MKNRLVTKINGKRYLLFLEVESVDVNVDVGAPPAINN